MFTLETEPQRIYAINETFYLVVDEYAYQIDRSNPFYRDVVDTPAHWLEKERLLCKEIALVQKPFLHCNNPPDSEGLMETQLQEIDGGYSALLFPGVFLFIEKRLMESVREDEFYAGMDLRSTENWLLLLNRYDEGWNFTHPS